MKLGLVRTAVLLLSILSFALGVIAQGGPPRLADVRKIYVEKMENGLDQYLTSEISKKFKGNLTVVTEKDKADAILRGVNMGAQNTGEGTVQLVDPSGKVILWSGTASDRDMKFLNIRHGGQAQMADNLISQLKKAMQK